MSKIEWTDMTLNPVIGCSHAAYRAADGSTVAHPGCENCYAEVMCSRALPGFEAHNKCSSGGHWTGKIEVLEERILWPFKRKEYAPRRDGKQRRVFLTSISDTGHSAMPFPAWRALQGMMLLSPWIDWQVLTKRPENETRLLNMFTPEECAREAMMLLVRHGLCGETLIRMVPGRTFTGAFSYGRQWHEFRNIHRYVSVSDQATADSLIPQLLSMPCAVRGVSAEPLLGPIDLWQAMFKVRFADRETLGAMNALGFIDGMGYGLDHVIIGGESGRNARLCHMSWIVGLLEQCKAGGVPAFVKQLGARPIWYPIESQPEADMGSKGQYYAAWPEQAQVCMHVGDVWRS